MAEAAGLIKLRDMHADFYNVDTLYILAASEAAAQRLAEFGEIWFADWVEVLDERLLSMRWAAATRKGDSSPCGGISARHE